MISNQAFVEIGACRGGSAGREIEIVVERVIIGIGYTEGVGYRDVL
jgi:hypothetical protein